VARRVELHDRSIKPAVSANQRRCPAGTAEADASRRSRPRRCTSGPSISGLETNAITSQSSTVGKVAFSGVVRPGSWTRPAGVSPARVIAGEPGSRPRSVAERRRAERGVKSLFGGSKRVGRSATRRESCSLVRLTTGEPSRSFHGEGDIRPTGVPDMPTVGSPRGRGSGTHARPGSEQERPVCAASSAKTARISQW
jgi:hypothetical protein